MQMTKKKYSFRKELKNTINNDECLSKYISYYHTCKNISKNKSVPHDASLIAGFFSLYNITVSFDIDSIQQKLKKNEPFLCVGNHNEGFLDYLVVLFVLLSIKPKIKIVKNDADVSFEHDTDIFFEYPLSYHYIYSFLNKGSGLVFFPERNIKHTFHHKNSVWDESLFLLLKRMQIPIVPIYTTSHSNIKSGLFSVFNTKKSFGNKNISLSVGDVISVKDQNKFHDISVFTRFVRASVYLLGYSKIEVRRYFNSVFLSSSDKIKKKSLQSPVSKDMLEIEVAKLCDDCLFTFKLFEVYCASAVRMPIVMREIGRLREYTFRKIGEETMNSTDLDEYDLYYEHLFIWDTQNRKIVGAYRLGLGNDIIEQYGKKGFYIHSLFKIRNEIIPMLRKSIELGRSFVVPEYQRHPYSLFLLWKGIVSYMNTHPEYRYFIGPVSISNEFSDLSKSLIVACIQSYYYNHELAHFFKPRKKIIIPKEILD